VLVRVVRGNIPKIAEARYFLLQKKPVLGKMLLSRERIMKKALLAAAVLLAGAFVFSQQPVVAVAPFDVISGVSAEDANTITDVFFIRLGNTRRVSLVNRSIVERVIREHNFQAGDWSDERKTAALGDALNADWIVQGNLRKMGSNILVVVQFYDIRTFRYEGGTDARLANIDEAYDKMNPLVNSLVETIAGTGNRSQLSTNFVRVEGGTFQMGSDSSDSDSDEKPIHTVTVKTFYISKYEVTQKEWREIMGNNPSEFEGDNLPVEQVNWYEAVDYCNKRSLKEGLTPVYSGFGDNTTCNWNANGYRLPTEAEWEYAAKGGTRDAYSGSNSVGTVAWYEGNSDGSTKPVGTKASNTLGLYDMSGNVYEWCWDWYGLYSSGTQTNPRGPVSGVERVERGGSFYHGARVVRSTLRHDDPPSSRFYTLGFRLARY
jgi:formylglycine-generating enzyme required for sulfatase activity/TolB-like protein